MKKLQLLSICIAGLVLAGTTYGTLIITPEAIGGIGYQNVAGALDAQPAAIPTAGTTTDDFGSNMSIYTTAGRAIYIDFGVDYNTITLTALWLGLKQYGTDPAGDPASYWSSQPTIAEAEANGTAAPDFLFNYTASTTDKSWEQSWTGSVTPDARYFVQIYDGTQTGSNRYQEMVFEGTYAAIPEPTGALLMAMGGVAAFIFRRRA